MSRLKKFMEDLGRETVVASTDVAKLLAEKFNKKGIITNTVNPATGEKGLLNRLHSTAERQQRRALNMPTVRDVGLPDINTPLLNKLGDKQLDQLTDTAKFNRRVGIGTSIVGGLTGIGGLTYGVYKTVEVVLPENTYEMDLSTLPEEEQSWLSAVVQWLSHYRKSLIKEQMAANKAVLEYANGIDTPTTNIK